MLTGDAVQNFKLKRSEFRCSRNWKRCARDQRASVRYQCTSTTFIVLFDIREELNIRQLQITFCILIPLTLLQFLFSLHEWILLLDWISAEECLILNRMRREKKQKSITVIDLKLNAIGMHNEYELTNFMADKNIDETP